VPQGHAAVQRHACHAAGGGAHDERVPPAGRQAPRLSGAQRRRTESTLHGSLEQPGVGARHGGVRRAGRGAEEGLRNGCAMCGTEV
jgi:hypothetical protein